MSRGRHLAEARRPRRRSSVPSLRGLLTLAGSVVLSITLGGCDACQSEPARDVVVYTSVDQVFSEPVFREIEQTSGIRVRAVYDTEEAKSTGVLNRLVAEGKNPQADVFWSGDPVRPFQLVDRGLVEPYVSPEAAGIPEGARDPKGTWTGFAARARILLVNLDEVPADEIPRSIRDLASNRWQGKAAIASPLYGTTTMHVAALFAVWGETRARSFLDDLKANEVRIAGSNGEVKRLVVSGEVAFGLTDTDDGNEAMKEGANVKIVYPDQDGMGTLVMPTSVVLMRGAPHSGLGQRLIDALLSPAVERRMAESAAHMPLRDGVPTPPNVRSAGSLRAMQVDYARVAKQIEAQQKWLRRWVGL